MRSSRRVSLSRTSPRASSGELFYSESALSSCFFRAGFNVPTSFLFQRSSFVSTFSTGDSFMLFRVLMEVTRALSLCLCVRGRMAVQSVHVWGHERFVRYPSLRSVLFLASLSPFVPLVNSHVLSQKSCSLAIDTLDIRIYVSFDFVAAVRDDRAKEHRSASACWFTDGNFWQMLPAQVEKMARFQLHRHRRLQLSICFAAFLEIYKIIFFAESDFAYLNCFSSFLFVDR